MDFAEISRCDDYTDISEDIMNLMEKRRWTSLVMHRGTGKTTLLSMLYYFFDVDEDGYDLFASANVARRWEDWKKYLNQCVVIPGKCVPF